mmetsp:Transcript_90330/g.254965  ORF Transcript_90330/g.254965 Transcript_90330/m.254965 type:complete len:443 (-) Transcript_90330:77-1405(-)
MKRSDRAASGGGGGRNIVYRADFDKHVIIANLDRRGWQRSFSEDDDEEWNFYWASVHSVRSIFNPEAGRRLGEHQIINHFPNHHELTRKDLMVRNIKRYRKECKKLEMQERGDGPAPIGGPLPEEWVPTTFSLPSDYALFVEEFRKNPNFSWIAKPTGKAQGRGIFLVSKLQQLKKWANAQKTPFSQTPLAFREPYIISRYISDPLLVGGKKFDMRIYVLVTSYRPLKVYLYKAGFCRFCVEQYSTDVAEFDNVFIHLTNVAIQKNNEDYNERHGGKWDVQALMLFIESTQGKAASDKLQSDMEAIIIHSLKAVQNVMINDRHCFEMYGFDILVDSLFKPWVIEVNASPSLTTTSVEDRLLKLRLINDILNIVIPQNFGDPSTTAKMSTSWCDEEAVGGFVCIHDEGKERQKAEDQRLRGEQQQQLRERRRRTGPTRQGGWR